MLVSSPGMACQARRLSPGPLGSWGSSHQEPDGKPWGDRDCAEPGLAGNDRTPQPDTSLPFLTVGEGEEGQSQEGQGGVWLKSLARTPFLGGVGEWR